ncbi:Hypothetical_protein [Hexamita inflata]|uniref:Hypothetical_protein n=1 Tax=Hexamita inflata TaxID=28002 RepID=A0AA86PLV5_9EUKA|nr:Hypothetical protein HINF_LOCUS29451 [Hexamita inflata]
MNRISGKAKNLLLEEVHCCQYPINIHLLEFTITIFKAIKFRQVNFDNINIVLTLQKELCRSKLSSHKSRLDRVLKYETVIQIQKIIQLVQQMIAPRSKVPEPEKESIPIDYFQNTRVEHHQLHGVENQFLGTLPPMCAQYNTSTHWKLSLQFEGLNPHSQCQLYTFNNIQQYNNLNYSKILLNIVFQIKMKNIIRK